ncbi:MAG: acetyl-CoA carboxylase biotin carboxyl carrier protein subunit [Proteobacteria bacterium]|nr:acetyl-CoA carboxylase biotin carboxyl carrier protein subunit [Pseudomonadota bacterium]
MANVEVESEITGNVWKVEVSPGAVVSEGQVLIILESMKMEIPVEAPVAGTIQQVLVQPEEQVEEDQLLLIIEGA